MNFQTEAREGQAVPVARIPQPDSQYRIPASASALAVMTDFHKVLALTVSPDRHIDDALKDMIVGGVRSLLVTQDGRVVGLVTAADILGERPIQFLQDPACDGTPCRHSDIHVRDVMTPRDQLKALDLDKLQAITIGDVASAFRGSSLTHVLVMQSVASQEAEVRGILSRSRIVRESDVSL